MLSEGEKDIINKLERTKVNITGKLYNFEAGEILCLINKLQKENEEKDKQIDLMAEVMYKSNTAQLLIEYGIENKEQLIKEFEKLAKEKGE